MGAPCGTPLPHFCFVQPASQDGNMLARDDSASSRLRCDHHAGARGSPCQTTAPLRNRLTHPLNGAPFLWIHKSRKSDLFRPPFRILSSAVRLPAFGFDSSTELYSLQVWDALKILDASEVNDPESSSGI